MSAPLHLTPLQLATTLILEAQIHALELGANQLGGFLGLKAEGALLFQAREVLARGLLALRHEWAGGVVIVSPAQLKAVVP